MSQFHDYHIRGYEVDSAHRTVKFKLVWPYDGKEEKIEYLIFSGVYGYELKNDSMCSIVFDFEEITIPQFLEAFGNEIAEAYRQNGAYGPWAADLTKANEVLVKNNVKSIVITSSIGMAGWLLAQSSEVKNA